MRALPEVEVPEVRLAESDRLHLTLHYALMTPLFGGGVKPRQADPITTIRVASIIGHLRFWWRACRAEAFPSLEALRRREDAIWGSTSQPSAVQLHLRVLNPGIASYPYSKGPDNRARADESVAPAYVSFPAQPKNMKFAPGEAPVKFLEGVEFELEVDCPRSHEADVEAALWAWSQLGGVGARTRRGFGALRLVKRNNVPVAHPKAGQFRQQLEEQVRLHVAMGSEPIKHLPRLKSKPEFELTQPMTDGKMAWKRLIVAYRNFRQDRPPGERPGRSNWPEPDAIRLITRKHKSTHAPRSGATVRFPRAYFGLPIIFHFKDLDDPGDTSLEGANHDRRASPLLLRPVACSDGALGMAFLLVPNGLPPGGIVLRRAEGNPSVEALAPKDDLKSMRPLAGLGPFQAFFKKVKEVRP